jgi:hypothetical protein
MPDTYRATTWALVHFSLMTYGPLELHNTQDLRAPGLRHINGPHTPRHTTYLWPIRLGLSA